MTKKLLMLTCATGALGLGAGVGHAATAAAAAATTGGATSVTELVVTAEHREYSLQKVPVAVSVFTGAQRDTIGINTVQDVTNFAPGFTYDPANVHAYIRGVGRQSVNVTDDQRVANYEDGFYVYSPYGLGRSSLFLSQEQIERGPQNVGGRNSDAGSIDMIDVRPTDTPYAEIRTTIGNYGTNNYEFAASGPITSTLNGRIAGFFNNQDQGFYNNLVLGNPSEGGRVHDWYLEGQLEWKPNDRFDLWVHTYAAAWDGFGNAGSRLEYYTGSWDETNLTDANDYVGAGLFINPNYGYSYFSGVRAPGNPVVTGVKLYNPSVFNNPSNPYDFAAPIPRTVKLDNYDDFNFIATYHFPTFDVRYNAGVQGYDYRLNYSSGDSDVESFTLAAAPGVTPLTIYPAIDANYVEDDYWTAHDLTFESTDDSPLQWIGGASFFYQHYNQPYSVSDNLQPQLTHPVCIAAYTGCAGAGALAPTNPNDQFLYLDYEFNVLSVAGYGQVSYKVNDELKFTGDIRYTWDDKYGTESARYILFGEGITGVLPDINAYSYGLGASTPAWDVTPSQVCLSGNPADCNSAAHGLGYGVTSMGTYQNGYATRQLGITSDAVTGGAGVDFTPTSDIFTYARYDRGYESPSFNAGQVLANPAVKPEYINSYQVGYKETFGQQLLVDLSGFYYDYENMQLPISITNGGVTQSQFINVPQAESTGAEVEAYWTPTRALSVTLSYSFDYTAIETGCYGTVSGGVLKAATGALCLQDTNDPAAVQPGAKPVPGQVYVPGVNNVSQSVKGDPLPNAPENKFAVAVAYTWQFDPGSFTLSGTYDWRDWQSGAMFKRYYYTAPSWDNVDLQAIWKGDHDRYEVIGYVRNLFNTLQYDVGPTGVGLLGNGNSYITSAAQGLYENTLYEVVTPRMFGMELRYKFF